MFGEGIQVVAAADAIEVAPFETTEVGRAAPGLMTLQKISGLGKIGFLTIALGQIHIGDVSQEAACFTLSVGDSLRLEGASGFVAGSPGLLLSVTLGACGANSLPGADNTADEEGARDQHCGGEEHFVASDELLDAVGLGRGAGQDRLVP